MTFYYAGLVSLLSLFEMNKLLIHDNGILAKRAFYRSACI